MVATIGGGMLFFPSEPDGEMFGGNNANPAFPFFLEENPLCYDSNASTQLQLFGNVPSACDAGQINHIGGGNNVRSPLNQAIKRSKGSDDINWQNNVQISLGNPFHDEADRAANMPKLNTVSTGLRLSDDDEERHSSITTASGSMSSLPLTMALLDNLGPEIERQKEEFDRYLRTQEEQFAKGVRELKQRHAASFLGAIDRELSRKLHDKDLEIESMNRKNRELADRIRQAAADAQAWQQRAQYNESIVHALRSSLQQAMAQGAAAAAAANQGREGCGDSEVDDAASSFGPNMGNAFGRQISAGMSCKGCNAREICMLLLPCRHLCLCRECDATMVDACPVCFVRKTASVEVYMS
ncbi:hypothetical protein HPP92_024364 [Vanilla planifolia]|uniref:RING-type domain-containing protein n=1 Tax=Vanilla planifolia TaxID=51239 RepID=A0A835PNG2_VANPL|nr:hypothetical protein HPP92_024708 [Vanilla planifolia]KAG0456576.1 hypothetical protein HPP92_024364 [Vanilla planifolia]